MGIYAYVDNLVIARTRYGITVCGWWGEERRGVRGVKIVPACAAGGPLSALKILERTKLPSQQNVKGSRLF